MSARYKIGSAFFLLLFLLRPSSIHFSSTVDSFWTEPESEELASEGVKGVHEYGQSEDKDFRTYYDRHLNLIPDKNLRDTLSAYLAEVSQIHSGANESLEVGNQKMLDENPCLAEIATDFYLDLMKEDFMRLKAQLGRPNRPLGSRIALDEEAGKGFWKMHPPGFLWSRLMDMTDGNPNLAFAIIKMCGHDDAINQKPYLSSQHSSFRQLKQRKVRIAEFIERSWQSPPEGIGEWLAEIKKSDRVEFVCMSNSSLYLPKSIGFDVDINENLKAKIERLQAPKKGLSALPAKYYHLLAGVATGCLFKQETGYSFVGSNIARAGAKFYRAMSLRGKWLNTQLPDDLKAWDSLTPAFFSDEKISSLISLKKETELSKLKSTSEFDLYLKDLLFGSGNEEFDKMSIEDWRQYIWKRVSQRDAAKLWKKWYKKTSLPGVGEVWLPNRARRPEFEDPRVWSSYPHYSSPLDTTPKCEENWTTDRCLDAIAVMDTWEVDFEWSQEAQWIGARFGEKNCRKLEANESLETLACSVLAKRPKESGAPAGDSGPVENLSGAGAAH
jgi:hypothetical protein